MWCGYERLSLATLGYRIVEKHRGGAGTVQNVQSVQGNVRPEQNTPPRT